MAIKRNGCRSCGRLSFQAPSDFGSKPKWMESSGRTGIFPFHPFSDVLKFDGVFSLKMHNRSIDSIRISERMVSAPPGQRLRTARSTSPHRQDNVSAPPGLNTTRSPHHQVIPLLLTAPRPLIKGRGVNCLTSCYKSPPALHGKSPGISHPCRGLCGTWSRRLRRRRSSGWCRGSGRGSLR